MVAQIALVHFLLLVGKSLCSEAHVLSTLRFSAGANDIMLQIVPRLVERSTMSRTKGTVLGKIKLAGDQE